MLWRSSKYPLHQSHNRSGTLLTWLAMCQLLASDFDMYLSRRPTEERSKGIKSQGDLRTSRDPASDRYNAQNQKKSISGFLF